MPYFDFNATSPLEPVAREAWLQVQSEVWHNPSSLYRGAARAKLRFEAEREKLADYLGAKANRLLFTSGATEAVAAIFTHWARRWPATTRVWLNPTEHACVLRAAELYLPGRYDYLSLDEHGVVRPPQEQPLAQGPLPGAVVVMAANNETGVLQPWEFWANWAQQNQVELLCDATQWLGKLSASSLGLADWVVGSAHKWGGPRGVGLLVAPTGQQEFRVRAGSGEAGISRGGTEDVAGVAAAVAALVEAEQKKVFLETERTGWRDRFISSLRREWTELRVVGEGAERLWNTVSLIAPRGNHTRWVTRLDKLGFQVSTGSACAVGKDSPSHVLAALRFDPISLQRVLRLSSGWSTTEADWDALREALLSLGREFPADEVS